MATKIPETPEFIKQAIAATIRHEVERHIDEAKKELERRVPEIITSLTVDIMGMVEMETLRDRIVFTIRKRDEK